MRFAHYGFPTTITYGPGALALLPEALASVGVLRPLVVTDRALAELPPVAATRAVLEKAGVAAEVYAGIFGNPVVGQVKGGVEAYRRHNADGIVALGGGAALDVAKAIAVWVNHPGELLEYDAFLATPRPIDKEVPPIITIPTTAGTGSEVGRSAVISDDTTHQKKIIFSPKLLARRVLLDPELTAGLPAQPTAATGMDALTHCVESYLSNSFHPMCDGIALEGLRIVARYLPEAVGFARRIDAGERALLTDAAHIEARGMMLNAAMMGAVAFQKDLGVTHSCAHALSTVCDLHHGLANAAMLPYAMRFNLSAVPERMAVMATVVGAEPPTGEAFVDWLAAFGAKVNMPRTLREVGVGREHIERLVEVALADACHQFNPRPVAAADFAAIFTEALG